MEAIEATEANKAVLLLTVDLRGFQGNGSKYGRLRGNVEHGSWNVEARKLDPGI